MGGKPWATALPPAGEKKAEEAAVTVNPIPSTHTASALSVGAYTVKRFTKSFFERNRIPCTIAMPMAIEHHRQPQAERHNQQHAERNPVDGDGHQQDGDGIGARNQSARDAQRQQRLPGDLIAGENMRMLMPRMLMRRRIERRQFMGVGVRLGVIMGMIVVVVSMAVPRLGCGMRRRRVAAPAGRRRQGRALLPGARAAYPS